MEQKIALIKYPRIGKFLSEQFRVVDKHRILSDTFCPEITDSLRNVTPVRIFYI